MSEQKKVTVFSTPSCPWCVRVKEYLKSQKVEYSEIDVASDYDQAVKMVEKSGEMGVPQLWIDDEVVVGFDQPTIDRLLDLKK